jgi:regulator of cell morphogenesis and NO signaling
MTDLSLTATVGAIAASLPGAAEVFRKSGISFCCGGKSSLSDAPDATPALIAHILSRYHDTHRVELDALIPLAQRVETVHGDHEDAPLGLMDALIALHDELDSHMQKEEQVLFPMMLKGGSPMIGQPIAVMRQDHDDTNKQLKRIEHITHGITLPLGACGSWTALYIGLRKLSEDLVTHMHLENTVLFPRFAA